MPSSPPDSIVVARGNAPVEKQTGIVAPPAIVLPGGKGYTLSVVGNSTVGGVKRATYLGSGAFDVAAGHDTPVSFTPNAGVDRATGESAGCGHSGGRDGAGRQRDRLPELRAQQQPGDLRVGEHHRDLEHRSEDR